MKDTAVILLAGGIGKRFGSATPKQFLPLGNSPVARYSFDLLSAIECVKEIVVVCDPSYQPIFSQAKAPVPVRFALPGERRQDSVYHGLQALTEKAAKYLCIHDAARPCITKELVLRAIEAARTDGAAAVGLPVKFTVKEVDASHYVRNTPDRSALWEIQTPQVVRSDWLFQGFDHAHRHSLTVTDDVSLVELLGYRVKLVAGDASNVKITTTEDFVLLESLQQKIKR